MSRKPKNLEEAIYRVRNLLTGIPLEDPMRPDVVNQLTLLRSMQFKDFGVGGLQEEHFCDSVVSAQPSFWDLIASFESPSMATEDQRYRALASAYSMTDMARIEEVIKPCRLLFASFHPSDSGDYKLFAVYALGDLLWRAFRFTNNIEYLDEAISIYGEGLKLSDIRSFGVFPLLIHALSIRFDLRHSREDLGELMQLYQMAVDHRNTWTPVRFQLSCEWAQLARIHSHPCTPTAYDYALSSMRDSLTFAPTVGIQHFRLVAMRDAYGMLPLDCASYQVHTGQLQSAVEILERGRALI